MRLTGRYGLIRRYRKALTTRAYQLGLTIACSSTGQGPLESLRELMRELMRLAVPLRRALALNMRHAGLYREPLLNAYFDRAIDQFIFFAHIRRCGWPKSGVRERVRFDESLDHVVNAHAAGKGVLVLGPHFSGYPFIARSLDHHVPCAAFTRAGGKDPRKAAIAETMFEVAGARTSRAEHHQKDQRLAAALATLRDGNVLFMTPDVLRKPTEGGAPVSILGRTVHLPTGAPLIALRSKAPIVWCWWRWEDGRYRVDFEPARCLERGGMRVRERCVHETGRWAAEMDRRVRRNPEMWFNWLDKGWTRILRSKQ